MGAFCCSPDGLDEVADEPLRARLCEYLHFYLRQLAESRAVVTCRYSGYRNQVRLHEDFYALDLRPLSESQVDELVTRWFAEASRHMLSIAPSVCLERAAHLKEALKGPLFADRRRKIMRSTPLLLTLLCVIVNHRTRDAVESRGVLRRMPRGDVESLGQEDQGVERAAARPGDGDVDLAAPRVCVCTGPVSRDDQPRAVWVRETMKRLKVLRKPPVLAHTAIRWLHNEAGVLREFAPEHLGFFHLGMQEYLCAAYIGKELAAHVDELVRVLGEPWWHEVTRLLVSLPNVDVFGPLVARVLQEPDWPRHIGLLHDWIDEAPTADASPFVNFLESETRRGRA